MDELENHLLLLMLTPDGKVVVPMTTFYSIHKKDYNQAWASVNVRYLPAFTREAHQSDQVDLSHLSARNNTINRNKILEIVQHDMFGPASSAHIRHAYDNYINHLYSNQKGELDEEDYPFELDGCVPKCLQDLYNVFFQADGPGMRLMRDGK